MFRVVIYLYWIYCDCKFFIQFLKGNVQFYCGIVNDVEYKVYVDIKFNIDY